MSTAPQPAATAEHGQGTVATELASGRKLPLCVDLDGTLINGDLLAESFAAVLRTAPLHALRALFQLRRSKAAFKHYLSRYTAIEPEYLPYNEQLLDYLKVEKACGRRLILVTASDAVLARRVADYLALFDEVIATENGRNLKGRTKANVLVERFGERGYIYAGDAECDLHVWARAAEAILVNPSRRLRAKTAALLPIRQVFEAESQRLQAFIKAIRVYQWVKNALVFVPALTAQLLYQPQIMRSATLMFLAFCLAASGSYIINDLYDLPNDRRHPRKRRRPFASGALPLHYGAAGPVLIAAAIVIASAISPASAGMVIVYVAITSLYSYVLKKKPLADVFTLALLYTIRIVGGAVACGIVLSNWLLAFSGFLFLALAFIKRAGELHEVSGGTTTGKGRGYTATDLIAVQVMGISSSFLSSLVLALYISGGIPADAYVTPQLLWAIIPAMLFWQCRLWLATARGYMHDDPIVYAARDKVSWLCFATMGVAFFSATSTLPPALGLF